MIFLRPKLTGVFVLESFAFEDSDDETLKAMQMGSDPD